jgi:hypothetical protein
VLVLGRASKELRAFYVEPCVFATLVIKKLNKSVSPKVLNVVNGIVAVGCSFDQ